MFGFNKEHDQSVYKKMYEKYGKGFSLKGFCAGAAPDLPSEFSDALYYAVQHIELHIPLEMILITPKDDLISLLKLVADVYYHQVEKEYRVITEDEFYNLVIKASGCYKFIS